MDGTASVAKADGTEARAFGADPASAGTKAATDSTASRAEAFMATDPKAAEDSMAAVADSTAEGDPTVAAGSMVAVALTAEADIGSD